MTDSAAIASTEAEWSGLWAKTQTEPVHTSCPCGETFIADVHRAVSARDTALIERMTEESLGQSPCPSCGTVGVIDGVVLVHDEDRRRVALVIPDGLRHRELEERAAVLLALAKDFTAPVPRYVRQFSVLFGGADLGEWLMGTLPSSRADTADPHLERADSQSDARESAIADREADVSRREAELRAMLEEMEEKRRGLESLPGDTGMSAAVPEREPEPAKITLDHASVQALLDMLEDKDHRMAAALELCERGEPSAVGPVFGAVRRMTRGEAVRVLPAVVKLGDAAAPHLIDGLRSRKAYLRQGCALALGVLGSTIGYAEGVEPLCDLLVQEPTEVWREVARAIGELGNEAVQPLAARLTNLDSDLRERISWALAHVIARSGRASVDALAAGRDLAAAGAARRALELAVSARDSNVEVRGENVPRDQTVNRAFSRRFFEAVAAGLPAHELERIANESDTGTVALDDSELMEADDDDLLEEEP